MSEQPFPVDSNERILSPEFAKPQPSGRENGSKKRLSQIIVSPQEGTLIQETHYSSFQRHRKELRIEQLASISSTEHDHEEDRASTEGQPEPYLLPSQIKNATIQAAEDIDLDSQVEQQNTVTPKMAVQSPKEQRKTNPSQHQTIPHSRQNLNFQTTIASLGFQAESQNSKNHELKVTGSAITQFFSQPFTAKDFSLPNIDRKAIVQEPFHRRALSINEIAQKTKDVDAPKKANSQMREHLHGDRTKIKKRNADALHGATAQIELSRDVITHSTMCGKPFRTYRVDQFMARTINQQSASSGFLNQIQVKHETHASELGQRSKSIKPDQKVDSADLRFAFKKFTPEQFIQQLDNNQGGDLNSSKRMESFMKPRQSTAIDIGHLEDQGPKSKALFIEQTLISMIDKERKDIKYRADHEKLLSYASKPLGSVLDSHAEVNGKVQDGIPPSIMEEWINLTLNKNVEDGVPAHPSDALPGKFKKKQNQKLTQMMGIDYSSLCKYGLPSDKAAQLLRSLFVHSVGFFRHIQELVLHLKDKKEIIINVWRVFYMLLENCQKAEHKLIMIELAESFERDKMKMKKMEKQQEEEYEQKISVLKNEIKDREEQIHQLNLQISNSDEEYSRLNQTYLILSNQNQEALTLRLRTEARLKELFAREREREHEFQIYKKNSEEVDQRLSTRDKQIDALKQQVTKLTEEKTFNLSSMTTLQNELETYKRQNRVYKQTIDAQLLPNKKLTLELTEKKHSNEKFETYLEDLDRQVELLKNQKDDANREIQLLRTLTTNQREQMLQYEAQSRAAVAEQIRVRTELDKHIKEFTNIDAIIQQKDARSEKLQQNIDLWRNERYQFSSEAETLKEKLEQANSTNNELKAELKVQDGAVQKLYQTIVEKEELLQIEIQRNSKLKSKYKYKKEQLEILRTNQLLPLENEVNRLNRDLVTQNKELQAKKNERDQATKMLNDHMLELGYQKNAIEVLVNDVKRNNTYLEQENSELHTNITKLKSRNIELEAQIQGLHKRASMTEAKLTRQRNETNERNQEIHEAQVQLHAKDYEYNLAEKDYQMIIRNKEDIIEDLKQTLKIFETRNSQVDEANIMMGEDYRATAVENCLRVTLKDQQIAKLQQEANKFKQEMLGLKTSLLREIENLNMENQDRLNQNRNLTSQNRELEKQYNELLQKSRKQKSKIIKLLLMIEQKSPKPVLANKETQDQRVVVDQLVQTVEVEVEDEEVQAYVYMMNQETQTDAVQYDKKSTLKANSQRKEGQGQPKIPETNHELNHHQEVGPLGDSNAFSLNSSTQTRQVNQDAKKVSTPRPEGHPMLLAKAHQTDSLLSPVKARNIEVVISHHDQTLDNRDKLSIVAENVVTETDRGMVKSPQSTRKILSPLQHSQHVDDKTIVLSKQVHTDASQIGDTIPISAVSHKVAGQLQFTQQQEIQNHPAFQNESRGQSVYLDDMSPKHRMLPIITINDHGQGQPAKMKVEQIKSDSESPSIIQLLAVTGNSGPPKQAFVPFKPGQMDLVSSNQVVYDQRKHLNKGFSEVAASMRNSPIPMQMTTVNLNENLRFKENLDKHKPKIKSLIKIASQK